MKKLSILVVFLMLLFVSGCGMSIQSERPYNNLDTYSYVTFGGITYYTDGSYYFDNYGYSYQLMNGYPIRTIVIHKPHYKHYNGQTIYPDFNRHQNNYRQNNDRRNMNNTLRDAEKATGVRPDNRNNTNHDRPTNNNDKQNSGNGERNRGNGERNNKDRK